MGIRAFAAIAAASLVIFSSSVAGASGTVVLTKLGGKPQSFSGARLVLKSTKLMVSLPDQRQLVFEQSSCSNTVEIMTCHPIGVSLLKKGGAHDIDFSDGVGYFNLTKVPQAIPTTPPQTLARGGLSIVLTTPNGTSLTIRGTLDAGGAALTGN